MGEAFVWPDLGGRSIADEAPESVRRQAEEAGHAEGYARGLEEGRAAARAEVESLRGELTRSIEELESRLETLVDQRAEQLAELVRALCHKVLGWELTTSHELLEEIVAEGMSRLEAEAGEAEVYLNPEDHALIVAAYHGSLKLHPDPQVPRSGVSVRLPVQAADFHPGEIVDQLFETVGRDVAG
jgi:flagellar assembly protein FliH